MSNHELIAKLHQLKEWQRIADEAAAEMDAIKDDIKAYMGDTEQLIAGEYKVTYKAVTTSRIDTTALKRALPDIAAQYTKTSATRRFVVA